MPVSYFFSVSQAVRGAKFGTEHGDNLNEIAVGGLVAFDLTSGTLKVLFVQCFLCTFQLTTSKQWQVDLGVTRGRHHANLYAPPVAADLDADGTLELVVADGSGHIHVLNAAGAAVKPWPIAMAPVAAPLLVEDFNADGELDIVALDAKGNLVCFDRHANELWLVQLFTGSDPPLDHAPTLGDVNGDGTLDIVIGTTAGLLYAVDSSTGAILPKYPIIFPHPIRAEVALAKLDRSNDHPALHLFVTAGTNLYIIDGVHPECLDAVTLGEESFSSVAIDDFTGDGKLDVVVTSATGHVFCLSTEHTYHPLSTWSTPWSGGTRVASNYGLHGIFATNREPRDLSGSTFPVRFEIVDKRVRRPIKPGTAPRTLFSYNVSISIDGVSRFHQTYEWPGAYTAHLPVPSTRSHAAVTLWMENDGHQVFTDYFSVSFNLHFHRLLKYVLLLPFTMLVAVVAWADSAAARATATPLPTVM